MKPHKEPYDAWCSIAGSTRWLGRRGMLGSSAIAALLILNALSLPRPTLAQEPAQESEQGRSIVSMFLRIEPVPDQGGGLRLANVIQDDVPEALGGLILMKQSANDPDLVAEYRLTLIRRGGCSVEASKQLQDDITLALREAEVEGVSLAPRDCVEISAAEQASTDKDADEWLTHHWRQEEISPEEEPIVIVSTVATSGDLVRLAAAATSPDNVHSAQVTHKGTSVSLQLFMVGTCSTHVVQGVLKQIKRVAGWTGVDVSFLGPECLKALVEMGEDEVRRYDPDEMPK